MKKIGEIAQIQNGYHARKRIAPGPNHQHRIVQMKDFDNTSRLNLSSLSPLQLDGNPEKYLLGPGDVLFLSRGQRNFACHFDKPLANVIASGLFFILRICDDKVLPEYLTWFINQPATQSKIKDLAQGSQIPMIPKSDFANIGIEIPLLQTQKAIIELDKLVQREHEILKDLSEKRRQLVQAFCHRLIKNDLK